MQATILIAKVLSFTGYIPIAPDALAEQVGLSSVHSLDTLANQL